MMLDTTEEETPKKELTLENLNQLNTQDFFEEPPELEAINRQKVYFKNDEP